MRIPISWHLRQVQRSSGSPKLVPPRSNYQNALIATSKHRHILYYRQKFARSFSARCLQTKARVRRPLEVAAVDAPEPIASEGVDNGQIMRPAWHQALNIYLPTELQVLAPKSLTQDAGNIPLPIDVGRLRAILVDAFEQLEIKPFVWLVEHGYWKTAVWLMEAVLNLSLPAERATPLKPPSNIDWPENLFDIIKIASIEAVPLSRPSAQFINHECQFEPDVPTPKAQAEHWLLGQIWETLGVLVVRSALANPNDAMDKTRLSALLVLGHMHNLGILPPDIYAVAPGHRSSFVQRPPILNLVSSRILTALSDAAWRQQQDDAISKAASTGMSMKEISASVPGGRFRLKVRPLGPEVWLELILWCCVESNHTSAAVAIVKALASQNENPWFAIRWTSPQPDEKLSTFIDWERVKLRHGGPTGLVEGYSRERPFVDIPQQTISTEVVLALVEKLVTITVPASLVKGNESSRFSAHQDHRPLRETFADIEDVMTFLEPHDLPRNYFDYLHSRLEQSGVFDMALLPQDLHNWSSRMKNFRALARVEKEKATEPNLELPEIYANSLMAIGLEHQAMDGLMQIADVHQTLAVFNDIQEKVDEKKVASIAGFLEQQPVSKEVPDRRSSLSYELEYTNSHGQLPLYKLAGFLNLLSTTNLTGLGRWLLFADDVDGAMIPRESWGQPCMTAAIYRFASASKDPALLDLASDARYQTGRQPSIRMLRALVNANIDLFQFEKAQQFLQTLRTRKAGGFGISNLVHLAAAIFRLETSRISTTMSKFQKVIALEDAKRLFSSVLSGVFSLNRDDFNLAKRRLFRQQVRQVLEVIMMLKPSSVSKIAERFTDDFPRSNLPLVPSNEFNILLAIAIEAYGAPFGRKLWDNFCTTPDRRHAVETFVAGSFGHPIGKDGSTAIASTSDVQQSVEPDEKDDTDAMSFEDPFFPVTASIPKHDPDDSVKFELSPQKRFDDKTSQETLQHHPVTVPSLQTLRLIVRAAADEYRLRGDGESKKAQRKRVRWGINMFKAFRIIDPNVVEQELQYPLTEFDAKVAERVGTLLEDVSEREILAQASTQDLTIGAPVSKMWIPVPQRSQRPDDDAVPPESLRGLMNKQQRRVYRIAG